MRVLVAEDDRLSQKLLQRLLEQWRYEVETVDDGEAALERLTDPDGPRLAICDWMMPGLSGDEVCRRVRSSGREEYVYLILLTSKTDTRDVVGGFDAGADDYIKKPFVKSELLSRLRAGERILRLEEELSRKVAELREALDHVSLLQGLLPICVHCKKIRDDSNTWRRIEEYITEHCHVRFSHGLCEECLREYYPEEADLGPDTG